MIPARHLTFLFILLLAGCATLTAPETPEQTIAYTQAQLTGAVNSAASMVESGTLSQEEGRALVEMAEKAKFALDTARRLIGTDREPDVTGNLRLAQSLLTEIVTYLEAKQ